MKRYKQANEKIEVPAELNARLLGESKRRVPRRAVAVLTAAALLCAALAAAAAFALRSDEKPQLPNETTVIPGETTIPGGDTTAPPADTAAPADPLGTLDLSGLLPFRLTQAEYPVQTYVPLADDYVDGEQSDLYWNDYSAWADEKYDRIRAGRSVSREIDVDACYVTLMRQFLQSDGETAGKNRVVSPLNLYLALSMLTELTDGESRTQILDLLGAPDVETVRSRANALWNANYYDDGTTTTILASSLWLNDSVKFKQETLDTLAAAYYAESFHGTMGSDALNTALRTWLNAQTGGLLEEQVGDVKLDARTVIALAATICYQARWADTFNAENNTDGTFHAASGDHDAVFMNCSSADTYYWGEGYRAVSLGLESGGGSMWLYLPDEGMTADALLSDGEILDLALGNIEGQSKYLIVNLSVPKFDVNAKLDLADGLKALGVTDVWDAETADFSPVTTDDAGEEIFLSRAEHAVRVTIDEEGCSAAAYTLMAASGMGGPPEDEVDFVLDRPFVFVLTSSAGAPLFAGVVEMLE